MIGERIVRATVSHSNRNIPPKIAEPGIKISTKFYDMENKDDVFAAGMMTIGVIYKF